MSWATLRLPKNQLDPSCFVCRQPHQSDHSLSNPFRKDCEKRVKVIAHQVDGIYHACHPDCFWQTVQQIQNKGKNPTCGICQEEIATIDERSIADPEAVVDNSERAVRERGRSLIATMQCDLILGARTKQQEVQKIFACGKVSPQDLNRAAVIAAQTIEFDCIPEFLKMGSLSLSTRDSIVQYALNAYDWPTVRLLLPFGVSEDKQVNALYRLAEFGDLETLNALLRENKKGGRRFHQDAIESAAALIAERGEPEMIEALFCHHGDRLTEACYANLIRKALKTDAESEQSRKLVRLILDRAQLSGYTKAICIAKAFAKGRFDIVWDIALYRISQK